MDKMKDYRQLIKELPSRTIVCAFGEFNPPTTGHELLVKTVNKLAEQRNSDHVIFTSPSKNNSLVEEKKSQYLKLMFPKTKFKLSESKISSIKSLSERYKNIVVVTGSEYSTDLKKVLKEYTDIEVISITEKDPDALDSKMKSYATKGIYEEFKKKLPSTIRELDARRLMNDMRETMGLDSVKEQIVLVKDKLRDDYFRGAVFNVGDIVESDGVKYTIAKRGSNHLLLKESSGALVSKWIHDVQPTEEKEMNEELTDKTIKVTDKIKVARIISTMLGVDNAESSSNPENLVNTALRKVRSKSLNPESLNIINKMLRLAAEVGIEYDNNLVPSKLKEGTVQPNGTSQIDTPVDAPKVIKKIEKKAKAQDKLPITFTDFTKNIYNKEVEPEPVGAEPEADVEKQNDSDIDADFDTKDMDKKEVGHTLVSPGGQDNLRRRKIKYHLGEQKGPYELEGGHENTAQHIATASSKEHGAKAKKLAKSFLDRMQGMAEANELSEVSSELLARYKKAAGEQASAADKAGDYAKGNKRFSGIIKATKKQLANDVKSHVKEEADTDEKAITKQELAHKKNKGGFKGFMIANLQRKVSEETIVEDAYKDAEAHLDKADKAQRNKDMFSHHMHMADHHDSLSQWHESKGRTSAAEKHANKAADHEEMAHAAKKMREEVNLTESHAELNKHISDFSKGVKSSSAKQSTYKRDNKPIHNMKHVETDADHQKVFDHLKKMGYKKTSGYDPKPNEFTMHHNREEMTAKSDAVHHASGVSAHIESEHGGKTKVHFTHRNIKEEVDELKKNIECPTCVDGKCQCPPDEKEKAIDTTQLNLPSDPFFEEVEEKELDLSDKDIDQMIDKLEDDELLEAYDEDELSLIDEETGEELEHHPDEDKISIMEVLSRTERMKAKFRLRRTASKRQRATKIALKRYSSTETVNKRARRLAIMLMKKRMLRGRNPSQVSVGEKERIERAISKRKNIIGRIASKLVSRIRKVEKARMSHSKFTKGSSNVSF